MSRTRNLGKMISGNANLPTAHIDSDFTVHSNLFHVDTVTDRVGVGTNSPDHKLDVRGNVTSTGNGITTALSFADAAIVGSFSNHPLDLYTNTGRKIRVTTDGNVGIDTTTPSYKLETPHVIRTHGMRMGGNNTGGFNASKVGYIGDSLTSGDNALYHIGGLSSGASSNASANWVNYYRSGHWGQYTRINVYGITTYYGSGFSKWHVDGTVVTLIEGWGSQGSISVSDTLVGSGTHGGQNINRFNITFTNPGTYWQMQWYVGFVGGGDRGHISGAHSVGQADDFFRTRGGGIHFTTLSNSSISESPFYLESLQ